MNEPYLGLFLEMGLGKTVITLSALRRLRFDQFSIRRVLVIAPKKVAEGTWMAEAAKWEQLKLLRFSPVMGSAAARIRALHSPADVYVISRDNVVWLVNQYRNAWPFDVVVVDELSSFKNASSKRFKALKSVLPHISRLVGLTGTPAPNGLTDLWAQIYLLDRGQRLGKTLTWYREAFFSHNQYAHEYKLLPGAEEKIRDAIKDICISLSAADYLQMPPLMTNDIPVMLDDKIKAQYRKMERELLLEIDEQTITAATAAVLTGKLLQLCAGAVYDTAGGIAEVHDCKLQALAELVESLGGQHALLFYGYRHDVPRIEAALKAAVPHIRIRQLDGAADCDAWNQGEADILLAHPASCAFGLNLQAGGRHVIWYGLTWSLELYQQANARLYRQGQPYPVIIHRLLVSGGMDESVADALEGKRGTQDALMTALKAQIKKARETNDS